METATSLQCIAWEDGHIFSKHFRRSSSNEVRHSGSGNAALQTLAAVAHQLHGRNGQGDKTLATNSQVSSLPEPWSTGSLQVASIGSPKRCLPLDSKPSYSLENPLIATSSLHFLNTFACPSFLLLYSYYLFFSDVYYERHICASNPSICRSQFFILGASREEMLSKARDSRDSIVVCRGLTVVATIIEDLGNGTAWFWGIRNMQLGDSLPALAREAWTHAASASIQASSSGKRSHHSNSARWTEDAKHRESCSCSPIPPRSKPVLKMVIKRPSRPEFAAHFQRRLKISDSQACLWIYHAVLRQVIGYLRRCSSCRLRLCPRTVQ